MRPGGEPAYPEWKDTQFGGVTQLQRGLTKREVFAAMAMHGFVSTMSNDIQAQAFTLSAQERGIGPSSLIARMAIAQADALLTELEKDTSHEGK